MKTQSLFFTLIISVSCLTALGFEGEKNDIFKSHVIEITSASDHDDLDELTRKYNIEFDKLRFDEYGNLIEISGEIKFSFAQSGSFNTDCLSKIVITKTPFKGFSIEVNPGE